MSETLEFLHAVSPARRRPDPRRSAQRGRTRRATSCTSSGSVPTAASSSTCRRRRAQRRLTTPRAITARAGSRRYVELGADAELGRAATGARRRRRTPGVRRPSARPRRPPPPRAPVRAAPRDGPGSSRAPASASSSTGRVRASTVDSRCVRCQVAQPSQRPEVGTERPVGMSHHRRAAAEHGVAGQHRALLGQRRSSASRWYDPASRPPGPRGRRRRRRHRRADPRRRSTNVGSSARTPQPTVSAKRARPRCGRGGRGSAARPTTSPGLVRDRAEVPLVERDPGRSRSQRPPSSARTTQVLVPSSVIGQAFGASTHARVRRTMPPVPAAPAAPSRQHARVDGAGSPRRRRAPPLASRS